jgi:hypothetical protein
MARILFNAYVVVCQFDAFIRAIVAEYERRDAEINRRYDGDFRRKWDVSQWVVYKKSPLGGPGSLIVEGKTGAG